MRATRLWAAHLLALLAPACITVSNPGSYEARSAQPAAAEPVSRLKVGLLGGHGGSGALDRFRAAFRQDLNNSGLFAEVLESTSEADLILDVRLTHYSQPEARHMDDGRVQLAVTLGWLQLPLSVLGVPLDWGDAEARVRVRALEPEFRQPLAEWTVATEASDVAGLYYGGWPLAKALRQAADAVLAGMRSDLPAIETELARLRTWYRNYGLAEREALDDADSAPALIRAAGDPDPRIRLRALAALAASPAGRPAVIDRLVRSLTDADAKVRLQAVSGLARRQVEQRRIRQGLAELADSAPSQRVRAAAAKAMRELHLADSKPGLADFDRSGAGRAAQPQPTASNRTAQPPPAAARRPLPASTAGSIVAVVDIQDASRAGPPRPLPKASAYLDARLAERCGLRTVPRGQVRQRLLQRKTDSYKPCYDSVCQIALGKALAAQKVLSTRLLPAGRQCVLAASLYDLRTETTEAAATVPTSCSRNHLPQAIDALLDKLCRVSDTLRQPV
jgi:hypothetical protein